MSSGPFDDAATVNARIKANVLRYKRAVLGALYLKGVAIISDAVTACPVEYAVLRGSHYVTLPTLTNHKIELGFGTNYAIHVHYNVGAHFKAPGTHALFLSDAMNKHSRGFRAWVGSKAKELVRSGRGIPAAKKNKRPKPGRDADGKKRKGRPRTNK